MSSGEVTLDEGHRLPTDKTLQNAAKLSIVEDRPVMMDYWTDSLDKTVMIGIRDDEKKMLIKNEEEYTSYIEKIFRIGGKDFIIMKVIRLQHELQKNLELFIACLQWQILQLKKYLIFLVVQNYFNFMFIKTNQLLMI